MAADRLIAIGASTGGTEAIKAVLMAMPASAPGVVITQHMPERFTKSFAERLDRVSALTVTEAVHGERILSGHAYIAPGHSHLRIARSGGAYVADLSTEPPVNRHRPSVDVLFNSVAAVAGKQAVGALLTGMGKDGALGLLAMRKAGAFTIAQNEATCVVYGMPREAVLVGGAAEELALERIAPRLIETSRMTSPGGSR
ncbi:chemotaxis protein CheB [Azoarcus communis]|nr:chemotaxis protein CheB [Parazoarcus communis]